MKALGIKVILLVILILVFACTVGYTVFANTPETKYTANHEIYNASIDISQYNKCGFQFEKSNVQADIEPDTAVQNAKKFKSSLDFTKATINCDYFLVTKKSITLFSEKALEKSPRLKENKCLDQHPIYIVSFKGIHMEGYSAPIGQPLPVYNEYDVLIDAKTGEALLGIAN